MRLSLGECKKICDAMGEGDERVITGVVTDSRNCQAGNLFACIQGEKVDGHDYALQAQEKGASAIIAEKEITGLSIPVLQVPNTIVALDRLAKKWREQYAGPVIAITGTAGKTTLKDTLANILSQKGSVQATKLNYNNQLGVALTILEATGKEDYWVIEAGISHAHDMDELGEILKPDLAIILNAGAGHIAGLGERGVAWHKARLCNWLSDKGLAIVNADYPELLKETLKYRKKIYPFSLKLEKEYPCNLLSESAEGEYKARLNGKECVFRTPYDGSWGAEITLAAALAANILGLSDEIANKGFAVSSMPCGRMNFGKIGGFEIYDGSYNANPLSMRRMLESAAGKAGKEKKPWLAVLGEMGELGEIASSCHRELGKLLAALKPALIIWNGNYENEIKNGLKDSGAGEIPLFTVKSSGEFSTLVKKLWEQKLLPPEALILFKGSRANRLENHIAEFKNIFQ